MFASVIQYSLFLCILSVSLDRGRAQLDSSERELLKEIRELRQKLAARAREGTSASSQSVHTLSSVSQWPQAAPCHRLSEKHILVSVWPECNRSCDSDWGAYQLAAICSALSKCLYSILPSVKPRMINLTPVKQVNTCIISHYLIKTLLFHFNACTSRQVQPMDRPKILTCLSGVCHVPAANGFM